MTCSDERDQPASNWQSFVIPILFLRSFRVPVLYDDKTPYARILNVVDATEENAYI